MQKRKTLNGLTLIDEDFIFYGDLTITGNLLIKNANLIVSGELILNGSYPYNYSKIEGGDISCEELSATITISVVDGDIFVAKKLFAKDIISDGDIEVLSKASCRDVSCCNYLISGNSDVNQLSATQDVYILGDFRCLDISARDILVCGSADFRSSLVKAKSCYCNQVINIKQLNIGK